MRIPHAILLAGLATLSLAPLLLAGPVAAQVYAGQEVAVYAPPPGGGTILLYPGGQYQRVVPPLLEPGQRSGDAGTIQLRLPAKTRRAAAPASRVAPAAQAAKTAPAPKPAPRIARPAPAPKITPKISPPIASPALKAAPAPQMALSAPTPAPAPKLARAEPPPKSVLAPPAAGLASGPSAPGLVKRSMITFAPGATDPAQSALGAIKFLATDLNSAMTGPGSRIQLQAFGGTRGDKGSDARRLSLKRALAIRQVLIDDGVPASRIDVHAGGGADDDGPADRVDVYIKA